MEDMTTRVRKLAAPLAQEVDVELVDVEVKGSKGRRLVRVIIDRKGGVTLSTCQDLSRALSDALDADDPVEGRYSLEVTSPGVDYPLRGRGAFDRVQGRAVLIHHDPGDGRVLQLRGTVAEAHEDTVELDADGERIEVPYECIVKASQTLPW